MLEVVCASHQLHSHHRFPPFRAQRPSSGRRREHATGHATTASAIHNTILDDAAHLVVYWLGSELVSGHSGAVSK